MDHIKALSGGVYTTDEIPEEEVLAIVSVICTWPDEDHYPEIFLP